MSEMPTSATPASQTGAPQKDSQATTALVLGILSLICCQLLGPVAWYMGRQQLRKIEAGIAPQQSEGTAKAGMILGIIATVFLAIGIVWMFFFGGLALIGALAGHR